MNIVCIILARGGSKGLPFKNIKPLAGKPLLAHTIEAAKRSRYINRILVSTDHDEIRQVALAYGAEVPFVRPMEFSNDQATSEVALKHAVKWLRDNEGYIADIVVYLQITSVFRAKCMIDDCIETLLKYPEIDSSFIGIPVHKNFWRNVAGKYQRLADDMPYGLPRQVREPLYREETGLACATRYDVVMAGKRLGNHCQIIPYDFELSFIDVHTDFDLWLCEEIIREKNIHPNET